MNEFQVLCICGSMRFYGAMLRVAEQLTRSGQIVLMPFAAIAAADQDSDLKAMLDRMHRTKIDMADGVVVVTNCATYVGESTRGEIEYAKALGTPVNYWAAAEASDAA